MTPEEFTAAIDELCLTQVVLARLLGVDKSTVNRWANTTGAPPVVVFCLTAWLNYPDALRDAIRIYCATTEDGDRATAAAGRSLNKLVKQKYDRQMSA